MNLLHRVFSLSFVAQVMLLLCWQAGVSGDEEKPSVLASASSSRPQSQTMRQKRAPGWDNQFAGVEDEEDFLSLRENKEDIDKRAPGWGKRAPGWGKRAPGWGKRAPGWGKRAPGWGKRAPGWGKRAPGWGKRAPGWGKRVYEESSDDDLVDDEDFEQINKRAPGWGKRAPGWGKRAPGWGKRAPGWGKRAPDWGKRASEW